jgi:SAM-dependent methyltransferase
VRIDTLSAPSFNQHYEGHYDENMHEWRRLGAADKANNIKSILGEAQVGSVLEVGCGTGVVLLAVKQAGIGVEHIGVDLADPNGHRDSAASSLTLLPYSGLRLPFEDSSIDLVYASHVVEHVLDPRSLLSEMARVSRRFVYIEAPCEANLATTYSKLQRSLNIGHINLFTPEAMHLLVATSPLTPLKVMVFDHSPSTYMFRRRKLRGYIGLYLRRLTLLLGEGIASRIFTYHCGVLSEPVGRT